MNFFEIVEFREIFSGHEKKKKKEEEEDLRRSLRSLRAQRCSLRAQGCSLRAQGQVGSGQPTALIASEFSVGLTIVNNTLVHKDDCEPRWDGQLGMLLIGGAGTHKGQPNPNISDVLISGNNFKLQVSHHKLLRLLLARAYSANLSNIDVAGRARPPAR